jgi:hypothetical protein
MSLKSLDVPNSMKGTSDSSMALQSMINELEVKGIEFDLIDKERVHVLLEAWRSFMAAELETHLKEALIPCKK